MEVIWGAKGESGPVPLCCLPIVEKVPCKSILLVNSWRSGEGLLALDITLYLLVLFGLIGGRRGVAVWSELIVPS